MSQNPKNLRVCPRQGRGFTLIEMITVLTIIILVLAIAIPVWNALMGGTNVAAAQNQISALLANARADAIYNRRTIGVSFFIDPNTRRTAMAEVQIQPMWDGTSFTSLFVPNVFGAGNNGQVNKIELVNNPDPNNPGSFTFYRDVVLLPAGVGVALNNNTFTYNQYNQWRFNPNNLPPIDRYLRLGAIMFDANGSLTTIPFGIPLNDRLSSTVASPGTENVLCQRIGMFYSTALSPSDLASNVNSAGTPSAIPLTSSVGIVLYDRDTYLTQHASATVQSRGTPTHIGDTSQFSDYDMNYYLYTQASFPNPVNPPTPTTPQNKFIEENWIDQNGIALMINPSNGSLIRAK
jgi:prepilin-type N-terminal cleavage/methylation domain-containing protein